MSEEVTQPKTEEERQAEAIAAANAYRENFADSASGQSGEETSNEPSDTETSSDAPQKPEGVPDKFWNAEKGVVEYAEWSKAHSALEKQFHESNQNDAGEDSEGGNGDTEDGSDSAQDVTSKPSVQAAADSFAANGELSDADYQALEKDGITREMVDAYIAGQQASSSALTDAAFEASQGEDNYTAMIAWAKDSLSEGEIKAFNTQVQSKDRDVIKAAVSGLFSKYSENATIEGDRLGGGPPSSGGNLFEAQAEVTAAINKTNDQGQRLYEINPTYRTEVMNKIASSRAAGKI